MTILKKIVSKMNNNKGLLINYNIIVYNQQGVGLGGRDSGPLSMRS